MAWLVSEGRVLASADIATTRATLGRGLLGKRHYDGALILEGTGWIHTLGMKMPIDAAYVDASGLVLDVVRMRCWRIGRPRRGAARVIEAEAGAFARWGLQRGTVVEVRP